MSEYIEISPSVKSAAITVYSAEGDRPPRIEIGPDTEYSYLVRLIMDEVNKWLGWEHGETILNMSDNVVRLIEDRDRLKGELETEQERCEHFYNQIPDLKSRIAELEDFIRDECSPADFFKDMKDDRDRYFKALQEIAAGQHEIWDGVHAKGCHVCIATSALEEVRDE
jgi:hypothetical protein